jgi:hypothetical protein
MDDDPKEFVNRLTNAKAKMLRSTKSESEDDAIMRLQSDGWVIRGTKFWRDEDGVFHPGTMEEMFDDKDEAKEMYKP